MNAIKTIVIVIIIVVLGGLVYRITSRTGGDAATNVSPTATSTEETTGTGLALTSSAFKNGDVIPQVYTCEGSNTQPPISWKNIPEGTKSLALTMYDPDVPHQVRAQGFFDHWAVFNIPATSTDLVASTTGIMGNNGTGKTGYTGPCPPVEYEPTEHRYVFALYALDSMLNLKKGATRADIEKAAAPFTLASTTLMGRYEKKNQ